MDVQGTSGFELLTASRLKDARACQRLHKYRYIDRYAPAEASPAQKFGTLVHLALEQWWAAVWRGEDRLTAAAGVVVTSNADPFVKAMALVLLTGYHERWQDEMLELLAVEQEFECELRNPLTGHPSRTYRLAGKIDGIVRTADGRVLIMEHKTASGDAGPGSEYWKRLRLDGQVSLYYIGAASLGYDVSGCLYDVLVKPAHRPLLATPPDARRYTRDGRLYANQREVDETADEYAARLGAVVAEDPTRYFVRGEVVRLEAEVTEALHDVWQTGRQIQVAMLANQFPRNPNACAQYGRTCPYLDVCCNEASLDDPLRFRRLPSAHPELAGGSEAA